MANRSSLRDDTFTRALLGSAESEEPSPAAYQRVAAALGVAAAVGAAASLPAPVVVGAAAVLPPVPALSVSSAAYAASAASGLGTWGAKLVVFGVVGMVLAGAGSALWWRRTLSTPVTAAVAATPRREQAATQVGAAPPAPATERVDTRLSAQAAPPSSLPSPSAPRIAAARPSRSAVADSNARRAPASSGDSSLAEQVRSLDRARVALAADDPGATLRELAHYREAWPSGVFLTEASLLEIEALAQRGDSALAAARARAFLAAHPDSPNAERLRALLSTAPAR